MDMNLNDFKILTSTCWEKNYQPLTNDMTKDKVTGRYRLRLNSIILADSSPFQIIFLNSYSLIFSTL